MFYFYYKYLYHFIIIFYSYFYINEKLFLNFFLIPNNLRSFIIYFNFHFFYFFSQTNTVFSRLGNGAGRGWILHSPSPSPLSDYTPSPPPIPTKLKKLTPIPVPDGFFIYFVRQILERAKRTFGLARIGFDGPDQKGPD